MPLFADFGLVAIDDEQPIQLPITGIVLRKIIQWCQEHMDDDTMEWKEFATKSEISAWDKAFVKKIDRKTLIDLIKVFRNNQ